MSKTRKNASVKNAPKNAPATITARVPLHGKRALPVYADAQYTLGSDTVTRLGASSTIVTAVSSTAKLLTVRDSNGTLHAVKFSHLGLPVIADASGTPVPVQSINGKFVDTFTNPVLPAPKTADAPATA